MTIYFGWLSLFFFISSIFQVLNKGTVEGFLGKPKNVRLIGLALIVIGLVGLVFEGWQPKITAGLFVASGIWRFGFPNSSIKYQQTAYPRWVHGILLGLGGLICGYFALFT